MVYPTLVSLVLAIASAAMLTLCEPVSAEVQATAVTAIGCHQ